MTETNDPQVQEFIENMKNMNKQELEKVLIFLEDKAIEFDNDLLLKKLAESKSLLSLME